MCAVPRTHNGFGDRSFGAGGSRIWNTHIIILYFNINFIFNFFVNYSFTLYKLASVRFPLNDHV